MERQVVEGVEELTRFVVDDFAEAEELGLQAEGFAGGGPFDGFVVLGCEAELVDFISYFSRKGEEEGVGDAVGEFGDVVEFSVVLMVCFSHF